jgi:hypothetical protein
MQGLDFLAEKDERIMLVCADSLLAMRATDYVQKYPDRYIEVGIAEQNAAATAAGLAADGLVPYFASQERFMKSTHVGRLCWLSNLLKSASGLRMLKDATDAGRQQRVQNLADMRSEQRNNHPLCEFEWTDKESGLRFYDDPLEGMVNIPDNAPPRPGAGAEWNVLSGKWGSCEL